MAGLVKMPFGVAQEAEQDKVTAKDASQTIDIKNFSNLATMMPVL